MSNNWIVRSRGYLIVEASYGIEDKEKIIQEKLIHLVPSTIVIKLAMLYLSLTHVN